MTNNEWGDFIERNNKGQFVKGSSGFNHKHTKTTLEKISKSLNRYWETHKKGIIYNCIICGKGKSVWPSYFKRIGTRLPKYCSTVCRDIGRTSKEKIKCDGCGTFFFEHQYRIKNKQKHYCSKECMFSYCKGKNHPLWKEYKKGLREINSISKKWKDSIFKRDDYTCQVCQKRGEKIEAHHILPFRFCNENCPEQKYNIENGVTLCKDCHDLMRAKEWLFMPKFLVI